MPEEKDLTSRRCTISQLKTHEMCDSILEQLEKADRKSTRLNSSHAL